MRTNNTLAPKTGGTKPEKKSFSAVITSDSMQSMLSKSLKDVKALSRFTSTLISVVNASPQLKECDAQTVISAALRGEGMGLIYGTGYYVVPYGKTATFLIGYKGIIQLCLATGLYADIDCVDVREGERRGRDRRTGRPVIDLSTYDTDEERAKHEIIGYKAYFELKDGYYREEYWTVDELLKHADRYSQAFSLELYTKWQSGAALTKEERAAVERGSPWYTSPERMMKKTVLRSLLNSGYAPMNSEVRSILRNTPESGEGVIPDLDLPVVSDSGPVIDGGDAELVHDEAPILKETPVTPAEPPENGADQSSSARETAGSGEEAAAGGENAKPEGSAPDGGEFADSFFDR